MIPSLFCILFWLEFENQAMMGRRDGPLMRSSGPLNRGSQIAAAVVIGALIGCAFAFLCPNGLISNLTSIQLNLSKYKSTEQINILKSEIASLSENNGELERHIRDLTMKLEWATQEKDHAEKQLLALLKQQKVGPYGTVKALRTNPIIVPDEYLNPTLANILEKVAVRRELIVALVNSNVKSTFKIWIDSIKKAGIPNYLVVALDDEMADFCRSNGIPVYRREDPDENVNSIGRTGNNHEVSALKFRILRELLQLGYSILLSDVDVVYLKNPFDYLYRDSDVECMTDGHDNLTAYGYGEEFDDPQMGWGRHTYAMRIWVYNTGFFYIRPTVSSIELLDRVVDRLSLEPRPWDQQAFNEELFFPSCPGYDGLRASKRTMDFYLFMNSKVLFKTVRGNAELRKLKPVAVHMNFHPVKTQRMEAIMEFYINGREDALTYFPNGSDW